MFLYGSVLVPRFCGVLEMEALSPALVPGFRGRAEIEELSVALVPRFCGGLEMEALSSALVPGFRDRAGIEGLSITLVPRFSCLLEIEALSPVIFLKAHLVLQQCLSLFPKWLYPRRLMTVRPLVGQKHLRFQKNGCHRLKSR